jgi:PIN domain nuclease of toxin-antitoxin system
MRLLLDTHIVIWWRLNSRRLSRDVKRTIATADEVFVSAASAWEVAIKSALGRLRLTEPFSQLVVESGFLELRIDFTHAARLVTLPAHHSDPFDRMLIAQAHVEGLTVVTHDQMFSSYEIPLILA